MKKETLSIEEPMIFLTLLLIDPNSKTKTLQIEITNKPISYLINQISESLNLPRDELRCIYQNKELRLHASKPIHSLCIQNGDIIYTKLRIKGGSQQSDGKCSHNENKLTSNAQNEKKDLFKGLYEALSETKKYFMGDEILEVIPPDQGQSSGELIDQTLRNLLKEEVHIIHPDTFSLNSIFSSNKESSKEAISTLINQIHDLKAIRYQDKEESYEINPKLDKPVIAILNTQGRNDTTDDEIPQGLQLMNYYGSHWVALVILPKGYIGLRYKYSKEMNIKAQDKDHVFLFDSLPNCPGREMPFELKQALKQGIQTKREIDGKIKLSFSPSVVEPDCVTKNNTYQRQQHYQDETYGPWAIYNSIMTVLEGSDQFWHQFFLKNSSEEETKFHAGAYLRMILARPPAFFSELYAKENENSESEIPLFDEKQSHEEMQTDQDKSSKKRKYAQHYNQRNLDFMILNPQKRSKSGLKETPSKYSNCKKRTKTNSVGKTAEAQPIKEKILINIRSFEEEQRVLLEQIDELQCHAAGLTQENEANLYEIQTLTHENQGLRNTIENQRIQLQEYNVESIKALEKSECDQQHIQELEELIKHQKEQA